MSELLEDSRCANRPRLGPSRNNAPCFVVTPPGGPGGGGAGDRRDDGKRIRPRDDLDRPAAALESPPSPQARDLGNGARETRHHELARPCSRGRTRTKY